MSSKALAKRIRVLVVDDSALMRKYLKRILEEDPGIEVIDAARDGEEAVEKNLSLKPDVITLDLNMPKMDGLTALQYIMHTSPCPVVVVSSLTQRGALATFEAFELGAVDCVAKPEGTVSLNLERVGEEIRMKVRAAARARVASAKRKVSRQPEGKVNPPSRPAAYERGGKIVVIGVSTGGPKALEHVLPELPGDLPAPVVVVQHMPEGFTRCFAERLDGICALKVREAEDGMPLENGAVAVARGGWHLKFGRPAVGKGLIVKLSREPSGALYIPSVSVTLQSLRQHVRDEEIIGVMLTGMGDDGVAEMVEVRRGGGHTIAESEETAVVWGMPGELWRRGGAEVLAPVHDIGKLITRAVKGR
ncbi:MAG: protein-glutamate methylesterase/protein-glutamine glutaminase [Thermacetogeniaceae bacterium]